MFGRAVNDVLDLSVFREQCVEEFHHRLLVALVPEERLETCIAEYVHISLLASSLCVFFHDKNV